MNAAKHISSFIIILVTFLILGRWYVVTFDMNDWPLVGVDGWRTLGDIILLILAGGHLMGLYCAFKFLDKKD